MRTTRTCSLPPVCGFIFIILDGDVGWVSWCTVTVVQGVEWGAEKAALWGSVAE